MVNGLTIMERLARTIWHVEMGRWNLLMEKTMAPSGMEQQME